MALTQSARIPGHGPSWDEEVVPALRKRLESESRTLSRRMSAISLSSVEDSPNFSSLADSNIPPARPTTALKNSVVTTQAKPSNTTRARTYSQPFTSDLSLSNTMANRTRADPARAISPRPTRIPKVSRGPSVNGQSPPLPAVSPPLPNSYPTANGYPPSSQPKPTRDISSSNSVQMPSRMPPTLLNEPPPFSGSTSAASSLVNVVEGHGNVPPLPTRNDYTPRAVSREFSRASHDLIRSSNETPRPSYDYTTTRKSVDPTPRQSTDSDERPFEHWYRGEVSRNGGVGEFRVGRRQEMLEIANYGHAMRNGLGARQKKMKPDNVAMSENGDARIWKRKRAGSVAGLTIKERERERGSLNLDEEHASSIGRVLDESPLTDLDGDGSDVGSGEEFYRHRDGFRPKGQHNATSIGSSQGHEVQKQEEANSGYEEAMQVDVDANEAEDTFSNDYGDDMRASTPTPAMQNHPLAQDRPPSRQNGAPPPTRIPGPSRQSSESRVTTPTPRGVEMQRGTSEPPSFTSVSSSMGGPSHTEPPPELPNQTPSAKKRGASPASTSAASKKSKTAVPLSITSPPASTSTTSTLTGSRTGNEKERNRTASKVDRNTASKANRARAEAARKEAQTRSQRGSVGHYPTPDEGDGEGGDMADAIPSWTQPIKAGNWDEVVLPVVARKKGMDGHYEQADGSPQPKVDNAGSRPAPAPGTFGYDHSKYRPPRDGDIPMDEFGQTTPLPQDTSRQNHPLLAQPVHEKIFRPATPQSPAPFSHYIVSPLPMEVERVAQQPVEEEEMKKGCCCVIM